MYIYVHICMYTLCMFVAWTMLASVSKVHVMYIYLCVFACVSVDVDVDVPVSVAISCINIYRIVCVHTLICAI